MTAETELLPCPFCGDEADTENAVCEARAGCRGCRAKIVRQHGPHDDNGLPEAIAAWNRRAQDAEIDTLRTRLEDTVRDSTNKIEALRAEVERANSWNERVSVCRDHVADIVDGPCVICALDAAEARADKLAEALRLIESAKDRGFGIDYARGVAQSVLLHGQEEGK